MAGSQIDPDARTAMFQDTPVSFTALEFDILRTLLARPGFVFTRELILDAAYAGNIHVADRTSTATSGTSRQDGARRFYSVIETVPALASNWDAARPRVDRRFGQHPPGNGGQVSASWFFFVLTACLRCRCSAYFLKVYQNQLIPADRGRLIAQRRGAVGGFPPRKSKPEFRKASHSDQGSACRTKTIRRTLSADLPALELASESVLAPRPEARAPPAPSDPPSSLSARA